MIEEKENNYLNDEAAWLKGQPDTAPLSSNEIETVQAEIDSIIGVTRDNQPILKLVWNGDKTHWQELYLEWDAYGQPKGLHRRPLVLYKSVWNHDKTKLIKDVFVPRWLLLQRSEPETYAGSWAKFSYKISPRFDRKILFRPPVPPKDGWYRKFKIIGDHAGYECCGKAAALELNCFGKYAHPRHCFTELRQIAASRAEQGVKETPFATPQEVMRGLDARGDHNYEDQTIRAFERDRAFVLGR